MPRRKAIAIGGTVMLAGASQLGPRLGVLLLVLGVAIAAYGFWPQLMHRVGRWQSIERAFIPALLTIPLLSALPSPPESWGSVALLVIARAWLGVLALSSVPILLHYLGKSLPDQAGEQLPAPPVVVKAIETVKSTEESSTIVVISSDDKDSIHRMTVVWTKQCGAEAAAGMIELFSYMIDELRGARFYWKELLRPKVEDLRETAEALDKMLERPGSATREQVIAAFNAFYTAYRTAAGWLYGLTRIDDGLQFSEYLPPLHQKWQNSERRFRRELEALSVWEGFKDRLRIHFNSPTPASYFLGVHEERPPLNRPGGNA